MIVYCMNHSRSQYSSRVGTYSKESPVYYMLNSEVHYKHNAQYTV